MEHPAVPHLIIDRVSKQYRGAEALALNELSISVYPGEVYGLLGPNGAGKSTTIRILMGFLRASQGTATILGLDTHKDSVQIKRHVGYLSGDMALYPNMTGQQYLEYMSDLQAPASAAYYRKLVRQLDCTLNKKLKTLSRGNRQKIGIVQAFMAKPQVLILDEPTSGLDPLMQEVFYNLIREAKARGASILMSSHVLGEVQKVCDRIGIIKDGRLVTEQTIAELSQRAAQTFDITFKDNAPLTQLQHITGTKIISHEGPHVTLHLHGSLPELLRLLATHTVEKLDTRTLDIEELFMHFYSDSYQEGSL